MSVGVGEVSLTMRHEGTKDTKMMLLRIVMMLVAALALPALSGQDKPAGKAEPKQDASAAKSPKKYVERKTPFGTVKVEEKPEDSKAEEPPANMRAFDQGDTVRFERPTPFGVARWTKKKSELNDMERAALERERAKKPEKEAAKP
jgi:hypothetical protein